MKHFVGFGLVNHDTVACAENIALDSKVRASAFFEQVGGPVPVALQCAVRLGGIRATHLGVVGADTVGDDIERRLEATGVNASLQRTGSESSRSLVLLDMVNGTRIVANHADGLPRFTFDDAALAILKSADLLHLDGRDVAGSLTAAQNTNGIVSLDLGTMRSGLEEIFCHCHLILASRKGGAGAFPKYSHQPAAQVQAFLDAGATVAAVTLGADGLALGWRGGPPPALIAPRMPPLVLDTCGAGDAFHGAFCSAYAQGASPQEAADFAQAVVCVRIGRLGNERGLPTSEEVSGFRAGFAPGR